MVEEKYELEKQEKLKLFFFIARPHGINIQFPQEQHFYILAYSEDQANRKGREWLLENSLQGFNPIGMGNLNVDEIVKKLKLPEFPLVKPIVVKEEKEDTSPIQFLYNLKLFKGLVIEKGDKSALSDIITRYEKTLDASKKKEKSPAK